MWGSMRSGSFTFKSTYRAFFCGSLTFEPWKHLWKSWEPSKCKIFSWLAIWISEQMLDSQSTTPSVPKKMQFLLFEKPNDLNFEQSYTKSTNIYNTK